MTGNRRDESADPRDDHEDDRELKNTSPPTTLLPAWERQIAPPEVRVFVPDSHAAMLRSGLERVRHSFYVSNSVSKSRSASATKPSPLGSGWSVRYFKKSSSKPPGLNMTIISTSSPERLR